MVKEKLPVDRFNDYVGTSNGTSFGADQPVVVSVLAPRSTKGIQGRIADASKSGLRITLGVPLEAGALVEVKWDGAIVVGEARYCRQTGPDRYMIGLKIAEVLGHGKIKTRPGAA